MIRFGRGVCLLLCLFSAGVSAYGQDAARAKADFLASNPRGGWTFGFLNKEGEFIAYNTTFKIDANTVGWCQDDMPGIFGDVTISFSDKPVDKFGIRWEPGQLCVNPGLDCQGVVIRWTAPAVANLDVDCSIKSLVNGGGKTSVRVLKDGATLASNEVAGPGFADMLAAGEEQSLSAASTKTPPVTSADLSTNAFVTKGTTIDFVFSKESELCGSHVGVDLALQTTTSGGKVSYNLSPVKIPVIQQVADVAVVEVPR